MRLVLATMLIASCVAVGCVSSAAAHADQETCPPVCDRIPDTAWVLPNAIPLNSTYRWPSLAGVAMPMTGTATPRFRFEEVCATPVFPQDTRNSAVAGRASLTNPQGQWQLQAQVLHWRGDTARGGQSASSVLGVAAAAPSAGPVVAALTATTLISVVALGPATRTPGTRLSLANWRTIEQFVVYSKPIVASTVIYLAINLFDRHLALERFGAAATGQLALATDLGLRLFLAINVLPETLLFQYALKRERDEGRPTAERQIAANIVLIFAVLAPLTATYMAMAPTIEAVMAPAAFRGEYARLSFSLAPGFLAFCALTSMCNPVLQLTKKTWPLTLAAVAALLANLILVELPFFSEDIDGLAQAFAISLGVGFVAAAATAFRQSPIRPAARDMIVVAATAGVMGLVLRPLNAIHPPLLAAVLSLILGGAILASSVLVFNVGGLRAMAAERLRSAGLRQAFAGRGEG